MDNEQRKAEIRRKLKLTNYPRRANASFTDENDHNPLILADCPRCSGRGKVCTEEWQGNVQTVSLDECPICSGSETTEEIIRYFENDTPAIDVKADEDGWVKCPCCRWKFTIRDLNVWTGRRHKRCGQKLNVI